MERGSGKVKGLCGTRGKLSELAMKGSGELARSFKREKCPLGWDAGAKISREGQEQRRMATVNNNSALHRLGREKKEREEEMRVRKEKKG